MRPLFEEDLMGRSVLLKVLWGEVRGTVHEECGDTSPDPDCLEHHHCHPCLLLWVRLDKNDRVPAGAGLVWLTSPIADTLRRCL